MRKCLISMRKLLKSAIVGTMVFAVAKFFIFYESKQVEALNK